MKRLSVTLLMTLVALSVWAEEINAMILRFTSGKSVVFQLEEQPVVTFSGSELVLTTHMNRVSYEAKTVAGFTYAYVDPAGVDRLSMPECMLTIVKNTLMAKGLEPESVIEVYGLDGVLVTSAVTDKNGVAQVALPEVHDTVYVVKTSVGNFKISNL